jgi:hypothetical protein
MTAVNSQIPEATNVLQSVLFASQCVQTVSTALRKPITYEFLCTLSLWHNISTHTAKVKKALQAKGITVHQASKMPHGLRNTLQGTRGSDIE